MKNLLIVLFVILSFNAISQTVVIDYQHLATVNINGTVRNAAEISHHEMLDGIKSNTDNIAINLSSLALVETMIYQSLFHVNEALKDAVQVKSLAKYSANIYQTSDEIIQLASENPLLLLFAEEYILQTKVRMLKLLTEVSTIVLQENEELLINYNVRDELITKVWNELQVINALMLSIRNSMYWAKMNGVFKELNPYQDLINKDLAKASQIIQNLKFLY